MRDYQKRRGLGDWAKTDEGGSTLVLMGGNETSVVITL